MNTQETDSTNDYIDPWEDDEDGRELPVQKGWEKWLQQLPLPFLNYKKPSGEAQWMMYYENLYKEKGACSKTFKKLLSSNGFWMIPNPYVDGHPMFYRYCSDGVTLADVDFVLGRWADRYTPMQKSREKAAALVNEDMRSEEDKTIQHLIAQIQNNWEKLYQHQLHNLPGQSIAMTDEYQQKKWRKGQDISEKEAILSLVYLFVSPIKNWCWMNEILHQDNIRLLCRIVYTGAPPKYKKELLKQWIKGQWITKDSLKWFE